MEENIQTTCLNCNSPILPIYIFCPVCGKKIKNGGSSTGIQKQIGICLVSFFLPPFGLFPAIKYLRQPNSKSKIIGAIALALTAISILITISLTKFALGTFESQLQIYQGDWILMFNEVSPFFNPVLINLANLVENKKK